jgi:hypothetical protein
VNLAPVLVKICEFIMKFTSKKIHNRIKFHANFDSLNDIDKDILPLEYGGKVPISEMIQYTKNMIFSNRRFFDDANKFAIRREMYHPILLEGNYESFDYPLDQSTGTNETSYASFRKLEFD